MDKDTKVYTLHYDAMPKIDKDAFEKLKDSIELATYAPRDYRVIKHFVYSEQLQNLTKINCEISLRDIRKYFGKESAQRTEKEQIFGLIYRFNTIYEPDCYDPNAFGSRFLGCSNLNFYISNKQILTNVDIDFFGE